MVDMSDVLHAATGRSTEAPCARTGTSTSDGVGHSTVEAAVVLAAPDEPGAAARHVAGPPARIGITGHSDLTGASLPLVSAALRTWLAPRVAAPWLGVSCLARGADQLFAQLVLELGGALEVVLPASDYRARKVEPGELADFDRLLAAATTVTVLGFERSSRAAYMAASTALLHAVDRMVAVWDGRPARRHGSTADVVAAARRLGLPVAVVWPSGAARHPSTLPGPATGPRSQRPSLP
jgi:hypothetical protein